MEVNPAQNDRFYSRFSISSGDGKGKEPLSIPRYLCKRKGDREDIRDRTFSLLPYQLVPYTSYPIDLIIKIIEYWQQGNSISKVQGYVSQLCRGEFIHINSSSLYFLRKLVTESMEKAILIQRYDISFTNLKGFIDFCLNFEYVGDGVLIRGPTGLSLDYYYSQGGWTKNSTFLFGTPSQFRKKGDNKMTIKE